MMKKFFAAVVSVAALSGSLFADGVEFKLEKPSDWQKNGAVKWIGKEKDVMEVTGPAGLHSVKMFDVVPGKVYKLEAEVKMLSGEAAPTYFGFKLFDKQGKEIAAHMVNARPGSETTVVKPVKAGDKVMVIKANPLWTPGVYAVALNAKKDLSDLPNYDLLTPSKITAKGQEIELQFKNPVAKDIPAGTVVRAHTGGGYMYTGGFKNLTPGQGVKLKGTAKGFSKYNMTAGSFAPGAAKAQIIMLVNWKWNCKQKPVTVIKDVELEIEK